MKRHYKLVQWGALIAGLIGLCAAASAKPILDVEPPVTEPAPTTPKKGTAPRFTPDPSRDYSVDDTGTIASANGAVCALPVDEIFEPYEESDQTSAARLAGSVAGGTIGGGKLNAWGCWTGSCCVAGHYEACAIGWCWVCDAWKDCERCIWPW